MSGMPAWEFRLADGDLWAIVAFMAVLPTLTPEAYRAGVRAIAPLAAGGSPPPGSGAGRDEQADGAGAGRGRNALQQYACITCHVIPGVVGANNAVGPSLAGIGSRKYLAGVLANTPENMIRWLRTPQAFAPHTAMPNLGVAEHDARDIAMFLDTLR